jgi:virginiamycin B lyase
MYMDKVCRWLSLSLIIVVSGAMISMAKAQQPSDVPAVKATGAQSGVRREMAELKPDATFDVGGDPDWMAVSEDAVWVTISSKNEVKQLRAKDNTVGFTINVKDPCSGLVAAFGSLWIPSCGSHNLVRASLITGKVQKTIPIPPADSEGGITAGAGSVWMASSSSGQLARIDPRTNKAVATIAVPSGSFCPIYFDGYVWITSTDHSLLSKVSPKTNRVIATIAVGKNPRFLAAGAGSIWTLNQGDGTITRVEVKTGRRVVDIPAGLAGKGGEIGFGFNSIWATLEQFPITRIDAATNDIASQWTGAGGDSIRAGHGTIWLTNLRGGKVWRIAPGKL